MFSRMNLMGVAKLWFVAVLGMRLTDQQALAIRQVACELAGPQARVRLFGSQLDDAGRGGDVDLLLELPSAVASRHCSPHRGLC